VCTWLASEAGQELTGQIIHVMRGTVAIMQQPALIRAFKTEHLWTQDDLDRVMPALLAARREHDARAAKEAEPEPIGR
jgi:hypothetical protein